MFFPEHEKKTIKFFGLNGDNKTNKTSFTRNN